MSPCLHVSMAVFTILSSLAVVMDTLRVTEPKIFTNWPFTKFADPVLGQKLVSMTLKSLSWLCHFLVLNDQIRAF